MIHFLNIQRFYVVERFCFSVTQFYFSFPENAGYCNPGLLRSKSGKILICLKFKIDVPTRTVRTDRTVSSNKCVFSHIKKVSFDLDGFPRIVLKVDIPVIDLCHIKAVSNGNVNH